MKVVYIAGPFRAQTQWQVQRNIRRAEALGLEVAKLGAMPLIPHKNTEHFEGEAPDSFWLWGTLTLMLRCDAVLVCDEWESSEGTKAEIAHARRKGLPVFFRLEGLAAWLRQQEPVAS